jgi:hypothetical protein
MKSKKSHPQDLTLQHWVDTSAEHAAAQADLAARRTRSGSYQDSEAQKSKWVERYMKNINRK